MRRVDALVVGVVAGVVVVAVVNSVLSDGLVLSIKLLPSKTCKEIGGDWFILKSHLLEAAAPRYSSSSDALPLEEWRRVVWRCCLRGVSSGFSRVCRSYILLLSLRHDSFGDITVLELEKHSHF